MRPLRRGMRRAVSFGVLAALLAGCASSSSQVPAPGPNLATPDAENDVSVIIEALVTGDTRPGSTDSLFAPSSIVTANGATRFSNPRLGGISNGGLAAVTASEVNVRKDVAWASFEYRWFSEDKTQVRLGRGLMVLVPKRGGHGWAISALQSAQSASTQ